MHGRTEMAKKLMNLSTGDQEWVLSEKEYEGLVRDSKFLANLEAAGVDNWEGYHYGYSDEEED